MRDIRTFCLFRWVIVARRHRRHSLRVFALATLHVQPKVRSVYAARAAYTLRVQRIRCDASIDEDRHPAAARTLDAAVARPSALSSRRGGAPPRRELREYQVTSSN